MEIHSAEKPLDNEVNAEAAAETDGKKWPSVLPYEVWASCVILDMRHEFINSNK